MPLTTFQKEVLAVLAANRSQESHFAGGVVLNAPDDSPRFSRDFDIFHEVSKEVVRASNEDLHSLRSAGFTVETIGSEWNTESTFRKAAVRRDDQAVEIDWAADSAFRFFPIEPDPLLGWRLHLFDAATNKALTLASRTETRDYIDIIEYDKIFSLEAICWAACAKDPGFTPLSLLRMMRRFARINPIELDKIKARALDPIILKTAWIEMSDRAETKMIKLADEHPDTPIGVAFVDLSGKPGWIDDNPALRPHFPSIRGCWPRVNGIEI